MKIHLNINRKQQGNHEQLKKHGQWMNKNQTLSLTSAIGSDDSVFTYFDKYFFVLKLSCLQRYLRR